MQGRRGWISMVLVLAVSGCSQIVRPPAPTRPAPNGRVSYHAVEKKSTKRYQMRKDITWSRPRQSSDNRAPTYPAALLARQRPPVTVTALLIIDTKGHVAAVRFPGAGHVDAETRAFQQAVRAATLQWTFTPLRRSRWKTLADGTQMRVDSKAMPFSQAYAFRFAVHDGKPVVSSAAPGRSPD